jgi:CRP-like cAMP-binding protein
MTDSLLLALARRFERDSGLKLDRLDTLGARLRVEHYADREVAFCEGEACARIFAVREGYFKQVYYGADGSEAIKSFAGPGALFACPFALSAGGIASFGSIAIGKSSVESIAFDEIDALARQFHPWERALRTGFQALAARKTRRERDLLMLTAEQLYRQVVAEEPALLEEVPQKDLAAYLGVTPVGLNRIAQRCRRQAANLHLPD